MLAAILTSIGLALPAGLNAWIPLLVLALADRFTNQVNLASPFDFISSTPGIVIILLLLPIELIADKIPGIDHVSDIAHTFIRPVVGTVLAAAVADASGDLNMWLGAALGLGGASVAHAAKMSTRPVITVSTGGVGNPFVSMIEDVASAICSIVAIALPLLLLVVLPVLAWVMYATWKRFKRGSSRLRSLAIRSP